MDQPKGPVQVGVAEVIAGIAYHHGVGFGGVEAGKVRRKTGVDQQQRPQRPRAQQIVGRHRRREQFVFGDGDAASGEFAQQFGAALTRRIGDEAQRQTAGSQPGQRVERAWNEVIALVEDTAQIEQHGAQLHSSTLRLGGAVYMPALAVSQPIRRAAERPIRRARYPMRGKGRARS